jgi:hypothetical protein
MIGSFTDLLPNVCRDSAAACSVRERQLSVFLLAHVQTNGNSALGTKQAEVLLECFLKRGEITYYRPAAWAA